MPGARPSGPRFADGRWVNAGPARIAAHHTTLDYCRELGVAIEPFVNVNVDTYVESDGVVRRRRSLDADLDGYVAELLSKAIEADALDAELTPDETAALYAHLQTVGAIAPSERGYVVPPGSGRRRRHPRRSGPAGRCPRLRPHRPTVLRAGLAPQHADVPPGRRHGRHPPGIGRRPHRGRAHGHARRLAVGDGAWGLGPAGGRQRGPGRPRHLHHAPRPRRRPPGCLGTSTVTRALGEPVPFTTGKIGLEYDRRFWETDDRILGGISGTDREAREIWYPSTDYLGEGGVLVGAYPFGPAADRFSRLDHDARTELALEAGVAIHGPVYRDRLVSSFSVDWATQPHSDGGWSDWPQYGLGYHLLLEPAANWRFAGDWLTHASGWQHGALESARATVTALHEAVLAEG